MPANDVKVNVKDLDEREWTGFIWQSRNKWQASVNTVEPLGSIKCGEFLVYLRRCMLVQQDYTMVLVIVCTYVFISTLSLTKLQRLLQCQALADVDRYVNWQLTERCITFYCSVNR
jgi:hypothetical protein